VNYYFQKTSTAYSQYGPNSAPPPLIRPQILVDGEGYYNPFMFDLSNLEIVLEIVAIDTGTITLILNQFKKK
jgi:hypothetical protein